jgi:RNA polymerase sigma factor (TIGR02999 family)
MSDITQLLNQIDAGDSKAASELFPLVYSELRRLANWHMAGEKLGQTLQPTALVHEAFIRLVGARQPFSFSGQKGFISAAAEAMRHILVDVARKKMAQKRGGEIAREDVDLYRVAVAKPEELLIVHDAIDALAAHDSQSAQVVSFHYFGGFSLAEVAEILGVSRATVNRRWTYAKIWLRSSIENSK